MLDKKLIAKAAKAILQREKWMLNIGQDIDGEWYMDCSQSPQAPPSDGNKNPDHIEVRLLTLDIVNEAHCILLASHAAGITDNKFSRDAMCGECQSYFEATPGDMVYEVFDVFVNVNACFVCQECGNFAIDTYKLIDVVSYANHVIETTKI